MTILDQVRTTAADVLRVPLEKITKASTPEEIETWDSVEHLNLILALETQFGLEFEPEEIERMKSIGDIALLVESKAG
ncbi:MAG: acyl carrier protein [Bryobacteraceae bacterium]